MTRDKAMYLLNNLRSVAEGKEDEAIDMAIEALHREEAEEKGYCHRIRPSNVEVVVLCKDCRWWNSETNGCKRNPSVEAWYETDFCKYGERQCNYFGERREP